MKKTTPRRSRGKRSPLSKAMKVLSVMVSDNKQEWGVNELARAANLPLTTVHRALTSMERDGLVQCDSGRFRVGLEFYRLAWRAQAQFPIRDMALRLMKEITAQCNESIHLTLYDPSRREVMFAASVDSTHTLRHVLPLNQWFPVYAGASGIGILAFLSPEERQLIIRATKHEPITEHTLTEPEDLEAEVERTRARGYACTFGQRIPDSVGIAAPFWGPEGRVLGDLLLTIPTQRYDKSQESKLARLVMHGAQTLTEQLGGKVPRT